MCAGVRACVRARVRRCSRWLGVPVPSPLVYPLLRCRRRAEAIRCLRRWHAAGTPLARKRSLHAAHANVPAGTTLSVSDLCTPPSLSLSLSLVLNTHTYTHRAPRSCTKLKQLFSRIAGEPGWADSDNIHVTSRSRKAPQLGAYALNALLADPRSVRAVLLREPVERFISAYTDKIVRMRCVDTQVFPPNCSYALSPDGVARFMRDYPWWARYDHMAPQVNFCGFKSAGVDATRVWNRIGLYDPSTIANVTSGLFDGRLDAVMRHGWGGAPERGMWSGKTGHARDSPTASQFVRELCANRTVLEEVKRAYNEDYYYFKLPAPDLCSRAQLRGRHRAS